MNTYVALLRGINVGGKNIVKMEVLKRILSSLGFQNVTTYIQSGNVIFDAKTIKADKLSKVIKDELIKELGFEVEVFVLEGQEYKKIISNNPFKLHNNIEDEALYVSILSGEPNAEKINEVTAYKSNTDDIKIIGKTAYVFCSDGYSEAVFNNKFLEKKLGVLSTTRNLKTVNKLTNMLENKV